MPGWRRAAGRRELGGGLRAFAAARSTLLSLRIVREAAGRRPFLHTRQMVVRTGALGEFRIKARKIRRLGIGELVEQDLQPGEMALDDLLETGILELEFARLA